MAGASDKLKNKKNMYTNFAYLYDTFMDNIPYEAWAKNIISLLQADGVTSGLVCELGCGTGTFTEILSAAGYDMIGIDSSEDMLNVAREKLYDLMDEEEPPILYLQQDMRSLELFGTVAAMVSVCDSMNYILTDEDMIKVLRLANNYLDPRGLFIFDLKTAHFYKKLGTGNLSDVKEDCAYIWENEYDEEKELNTYLLTLFEEDEDGKYQRSEEVHVQRAYTIEKIKELVKASGMKLESVMDAETLKEADEDADRILVVARETKQEGKYYV